MGTLLWKVSQILCSWGNRAINLDLVLDDISELSFSYFATFQIILFQGSHLMGGLCANIWQLYAIMTCL